MPIRRYLACELCELGPCIPGPIEPGWIRLSRPPDTALPMRIRQSIFEEPIDWDSPWAKGWFICPKCADKIADHVNERTIPNDEA